MSDTINCLNISWTILVMVSYLILSVVLRRVLQHPVAEPEHVSKRGMTRVGQFLYSQQRALPFHLEGRF